jgi:hypothetical protein
MLLLDFKKAYDKVESPLLMKKLEDFGLPMIFCNMVDTLLIETVALEWRQMTQY